MTRATRHLLALPDSRVGSHCPLRRTVRYKNYAQREMELCALKAASYSWIPSNQRVKRASRVSSCEDHSVDVYFYKNRPIVRLARGYQAARTIFCWVRMRRLLCCAERWMFIVAFLVDTSPVEFVWFVKRYHGWLAIAIATRGKVFRCFIAPQRLRF